MRVIKPVATLACVGVIALLGACRASQHAPVSGGSGERALGSFDDSARRDGADSIFAALDLPTPNQVRLGSGAPGPGYWQQRVDYDIDATLDAPAQRLDATMRVTYHNNSPHRLDYLWLQLEQNLFTPDSLGALSRNPGGVMKQLDGVDAGYDLGEVTAQGRTLDVRVYDTLARVELPEPIEPGATFEFELDFAFDMPPHLRRMGSEEVEDGVIFEYAQWFPHVCKYDDVSGWNTMPYLGTGEFYTDFGDYNVALTVPASHLVGATGTLINPEEVLTPEQLDRLETAKKTGEPVVIRSGDEVNDSQSRPRGRDTLTWRFRAEDVRTFAWATSEAFIWDACSATITGLDGKERSVLCQSLYPREATAWSPEDEGGGSTRYIKHSIEHYSETLYPYPYPSMINVNGPEGGMEYPGIVFCGAKTNPEGLMSVTDHEVGHTWFPMIVNTNERRHVWMDEGFNSFINMYSKAAWYERDVDASRHRQQTMQMAGETNPMPVATVPDQMWSRWVGRLGYRKPAYGLYLLREVILGPERFDTAFRAYVHRWAFKSPQPADFFRTMEDAAGADLAWFWRGWFLETAPFDQSIDDVSVNADGMASATLTNHERLVMPVLLRVTYDDDRVEDRVIPVEAWFSTNRWRTWWPTGGAAIRKVELDPDGLLPDEDRSNNTWESPGHNNR